MGLPVHFLDLFCVPGLGGFPADFQGGCQESRFYGEFVSDKRPPADLFPVVQFLVDFPDMAVDRLADTSGLQGFFDVEFFFCDTEQTAGAFRVQEYQDRDELAVVRDDERLFHHGVAADFQLDGIRAYVLARTRFQKFLDAARQEEEPVVVDKSLIAGAEITIRREGFAIQVGPVVVPGKDAVAFDQNFVVLSDLDGKVVKWLAHGTDRLVVFAVGTYDGRTFGKAVPFVDRQPDVQQETADTLVEGAAAGNDHPEIAADGIPHPLVHEAVVETAQ